VIVRGVRTKSVRAENHPLNLIWIMPAKGNDAKPAELLLTHWSRPVYSHALHFITSIMRRALFFFLLPVITSSLHAQPSEDTVRRKVIGKEVIVTGFPAVDGTTPAPITTYDRQTPTDRDESLRNGLFLQWHRGRIFVH
jgi:hypothetical protein